MPRALSILVAVCLSTAPPSTQPQHELSYGRGLDVPYVVTPPDVVRAMLELANVKPGDTVVDLGCGDGRIVIMAASDFGARGIGYDLDPRRIAEARNNAAKAGVRDKVEFVKRDLFAASISEASVVTLFLTPSVNERLRPRLLAELKPGARIVSHEFLMGDWTPERTAEVQGRKIYCWTVPGKNAGESDPTSGPRAMTAASASAAMSGGTCPVDSGSWYRDPDDTTGYFVRHGAPHPRACEVDADCRAGPGVNPKDGCCDTGVEVGVYGTAYLSWRADWVRKNCARARCPMLPPPAPPLPCSLEGRCCDKRCIDRCR